MKTTPRNTHCRPHHPRPLAHATRPSINPHVYSLMTIPFPVFTTNAEGKVVPTISVPEFQQLVLEGSRYQE